MIDNQARENERTVKIENKFYYNDNIKDFC